jgi:hypothetical protein
LNVSWYSILNSITNSRFGNLCCQKTDFQKNMIGNWFMSWSLNPNHDSARKFYKQQEAWMLDSFLLKSIANEDLILQSWFLIKEQPSKSMRMVIDWWHDPWTLITTLQENLHYNMFWMLLLHSCEDWVL